MESVVTSIKKANLPASSDAGPAISGPIANARTKMDTSNARMVILVSSNSSLIWPIAGAW